MMKGTSAKLNDEFLQKTARYVSELMLESFDKEHAEAESFEPSEKFRNAVAEIMIKQKKRRTLKTVRTVLVIAAILITMLIFTFGVSANRNAKFMFITKEHGCFMDVDYDRNEISMTDIPMEIEEYRLPSYIPEGFEETYSDKNSHFLFSDYRCGEKIIMYSQYILESNITLNVSNSDKLEISVNGNIGIYICNDGIKSIAWSDNEYTYILSSNLDLMTMLEIAESVG